ncbi:MAG: hypothetical protein WA902_21725 [Thermosynechococcaceae cyanobacterium]
MAYEDLIQCIADLPPEGQRQVTDFIAFMQQRYGRLSRLSEQSGSSVESESFIGVWQDRDDLPDSNAWVRNVRKSEWM